MERLWSTSKKSIFSQLPTTSCRDGLLTKVTPYNVGSVLWRLFSTLEVVQYIGGIASVLWGDSFSTVGGSFSTVGDSFSTVEVVQYSGGITSVYAGDSFSTVGDNISTVEGIQYCGGIPSVLWRDNSSTCGEG